MGLLRRHAGAVALLAVWLIPPGVWLAYGLLRAG